MKVEIPTALLALLTGAACAASQAPVAGEYRMLGGALACISDSPDGADDCLHIGPFALGDSRAAIENRLGASQQSERQPDGSVAHVYALPAETDVVPYFVIVYRDDRVIALQITGPPTTAKISFSSLRLGDPVARVTSILGPPTSIVDAPEVKGHLWSFHPHPISIEIVDERIFSIRVFAP